MKPHINEILYNTFKSKIDTLNPVYTNFRSIYEMKINNLILDDIRMQQIIYLHYLYHSPNKEVKQINERLSIRNKESKK